MGAYAFEKLIEELDCYLMKHDN